MKYLKPGLYILFTCLAIFFGIIIYDKITGSDSLNILRNARGGFLFTALIMSCSVLILIGSVLYQKSYIKGMSADKPGIDKFQIDYLKELLNTDQHITEATKRNIENKISELERNNSGII